jgi:hypothetical protein
VDLSVVGHLRHLPGLMAVLDEASRVRVALDAVSFDQPDAQPVGLAEPVSIVAIDRNNLHRFP